MRHENLLLRAGRYCRAHKITERELGRSLGDNRMMERLRANDRVKPETWDKLEKFLELNGG